MGLLPTFLFPFGGGYHATLRLSTEASLGGRVPMTAASSSASRETIDVLLVGSGIMSASLAAMLKGLEPRLSIRVVEITPELSREASAGWNNAGTGHAGLCEISYTPAREADGSVKIGRALAIFEQFEHSKQFWAHAVASGMAGEPGGFIHAVPHICFVQGAADVDFLQARQAALREHHFFRSMQITADPATIQAWAPLVMEGRGPVPVAATRVDGGTEVTFGLLARRLLGWLGSQEGCDVATGCRVTGLRKEAGEWRVAVTHLASGERLVHRARFVFVGAGGGSLPLLQSTGLPEAAGLGGFPIGGQWLVCDDPALAARHEAKVYGPVPPSSPSLGAPHLDLRRLDGRRQLLFGPFGSWTTRFLKQTGRWTDLPASLRPGNLTTLLRAAVHNRPLVQYLVEQALQSMESRMGALRQFYPLARTADWRLVEAGIRVQTIKKADRGAVYFGTEVFSAPDKSLAALLGASPGASVAVNIAHETIKTCLPHILATAEGRARMQRMIPTYDEDLKLPANAGLFDRTSRAAEETLGLAPKPS
jgi:malate dehydrogenase (quinone)